jgi:hypothetical protein
MNQTKNNILLLVIVILILVFLGLSYLVLNKKELFQSERLRHQCFYYPWGPKLDFCTNNCMNEKRIGLWDADGTKCNDIICEELCGSCTNESSCQWIASWSKEEKEKMLKIGKKDTQLSNMVPKKCEISAITYPISDSSVTATNTQLLSRQNVVIKVLWTNHEDSNKYMIHFYDMGRSDNMVKVQSLDARTNATPPVSKSEYELKGLNANSEYSIIMYSINAYGISEGSNLIIVKT